MTDSRALKELIHKKGLKMKYVAETLGLSSYGFSLKINNECEFKTSEILALCDILDISDLNEREALFFNTKDDLKSTNRICNR